MSADSRAPSQCFSPYGGFIRAISVEPESVTQCENGRVRILVTGAGGYLGRAVVEQLAVAGHQPIAMVRSGNSAPGVLIRRSDLLGDPGLNTALAGVDAVVHLAGLTRARESMVDPLPYFRVNAGGTVALLEAMAAAEVTRMVFASTGAIYGSPDRQPMSEELPDAPPHPYAASKLAAEHAIEAQAATGSLSATIVRLMNVAGGLGADATRLIPRALAAAVERSVLGVNGDGKVVRDYVHIADAVAAVIACLENMPPLGESRRGTS